MLTKKGTQSVKFSPLLPLIKNVTQGSELGTNEALELSAVEGMAVCVHGVFQVSHTFVEESLSECLSGCKVESSPAESALSSVGDAPEDEQLKQYEGVSVSMGAIV